MEEIRLITKYFWGTTILIDVRPNLDTFTETVSVHVEENNSTSVWEPDFIRIIYLNKRTSEMVKEFEGLLHA